MSLRWVAITKKAARQLVRDRMALFFSLLFPLIFIIIFGAAFGQFTGGNTTYNIAIINYDRGVELNDSQINHGENLISILKEMKYLDTDGKNTSTKVFDVRSDLTEKKAQELVEDRDIAAYFIIPQNFSAAVLAESMRYVESAISASFASADPATIQLIIQQLMGNITGNASAFDFGIPEYDRNATATVEIQGDPSQQSFFTVSGIIEGMLRGYVEQAGIQSLKQSQEYLPFAVDPAAMKPHVNVKNLATESSEFSAFDYMVPGLIVFALLMGAMGVTISLAKEESHGTLTRLKLTKMSSFDMLFGTTIPFTLLGIVQMVILLGVALLIGYNYNSSANIGLAFIVVIIGALASVALGLILAAIAKNEDQAGSLAPAICVPVSFLTGAFFPLPTVTLTDNFLGTGKSFEIFDWLPWTQCSKALGKILTFGSDFQDVAVDIVLMITFTIIFFIIGVILYHKKRLRST